MFTKYFSFDCYVQLFGSVSGNKLIAIVGPEFARWCAGDEDSVDKLVGGVVVSGCGRVDDDECVECRIDDILAGDDGRGTDDCDEFIIEPRVGLWYDDDLVVGAEDGERRVWLRPLL